ncbi:MAG TPA: hypothetical protein VFH61_18880 [Thermoleophilia bacterium]|nr:hypothetical protein [Thermoleophilia bacterium]
MRALWLAIVCWAIGHRPASDALLAKLHYGTCARCGHAATFNWE